MCREGCSGEMGWSVEESLQARRIGVTMVFADCNIASFQFTFNFAWVLVIINQISRTSFSKKKERKNNVVKKNKKQKNTKVKKNINFSRLTVLPDFVNL